MKDVLVRLMGDVRYKHKNDCDGLSLLGSGKVVRLNAHRLVALQDLLGMIVNNEVGDLYERFVYNHQLYSSVNYTRSKWYPVILPPSRFAPSRFAPKSFRPKLFRPQVS